MKTTGLIEFYASNSKSDSKSKPGVSAKAGRCCTCKTTKPPKKIQ